MNYTPKDIWADDKNHFKTNGKTTRKGSMAAALANAKILESITVTAEEKQAALEALEQLAPTWVSFELTKFLQWKNV